MSQRPAQPKDECDPVYKSHAAFAARRRKEALRKLHAPHRRRSLIWQVLAFALVVAFWRLPVVNPLKLLIVLFHEFSHVFGVLASGGEVFGISIEPGGEGYTQSVGGNPVFVAFMGYIGGIAMGASLYVASAVWEQIEVWFMLCIICCVCLMSDWLNYFTPLFGYGAIFLTFIGLALPEESKRFIVRLIATSCCLYPALDSLGTASVDALVLANLFGMRDEVVTVVWVFAGLSVAVFLIFWAANKDAQEEVKRAFLMRRRHRREPEYKKYDPHDPSSINKITIR